MAAAPPPPLPDGSVDDAALFLVGLLQELRTELQDLQRSLAKLKRAVENPLATAATLEAAIDDAASVFDVDRAQFAQLLTQVRAVLDGSPGEYARIGDEVGHVVNAFDRVAMGWPRGRTSPEALTQAVAALGELLDEAVYHIALVTTPQRLNDHLRHLPIGQALDFEAAFGDELTNSEQRRRVLEYLATHPMARGSGGRRERKDLPQGILAPGPGRHAARAADRPARRRGARVDPDLAR